VLTQAEADALLAVRKGFPAGIVQALEAYEVVPAPWSERERFAEELAA